MRTRLLGAVMSAAALAVLGGCSAAGGPGKVAAASSLPSGPARSADTGSVPEAGPIEAASALPKECSQILSTEQLQAVFGAGFPIGVDYGSYAPLPSIGRTGRVACIFGVGLDSFGRQSAGSLEVSISTYTSAADAVGRAADTVQSDSQAGATEASVSVGGHPATVVVEQSAVGATSTAEAMGSAPATASPSPSASASPAATGSPSSSPTASPAPTSPSPSADPTANNGETQLVMADGNRTFVLQIPFGKLAAEQAATALTGLMLEVYQNTLPSASADASPDASADASSGPSGSPSPAV